MCEDTLLSLSEDECVQACGENESEVTGSLGQRYCACDDPKVVQIVGGAKKCLNEAPTCETNMDLNPETNVCECKPDFTKQLLKSSDTSSSLGFKCINASTTACESGTVLTLDRSMCVFNYSGVCGARAEVV